MENLPGDSEERRLERGGPWKEQSQVVWERGGFIGEEEEMEMDLRNLLRWKQEKRTGEESKTCCLSRVFLCLLLVFCLKLRELRVHKYYKWGPLISSLSHSK